MSDPVERRHAHMVDDPRRMGPLLRAIRAAVKKGSVVADIGTGTGVLAIEAARSGAKRVWAIEFDKDALVTAKRKVRDAGQGDRIAFMSGISFDIDLPERVDLIICETIGSFGFDENILATLADAKRRFLKARGRLVPSCIELWGAPTSHVPDIHKTKEIAAVDSSLLLGDPVKLSIIDFSLKIPKEIHVKREFKLDKEGSIKAIALWPKIIWHANSITDCSPFAPQTHWMQGILPIDSRRSTPGKKVRLELIICPHPDDPQKMTERMWRWCD